MKRRRGGGEIRMELVQVNVDDRAPAANVSLIDDQPY